MLYFTVLLVYMYVRHFHYIIPSMHTNHNLFFLLEVQLFLYTHKKKNSVRYTIYVILLLLLDIPF